MCQPQCFFVFLLYTPEGEVVVVGVGAQPDHNKPPSLERVPAAGRFRCSQTHREEAAGMILLKQK